MSGFLRRRKYLSILLAVAGGIVLVYCFLDPMQEWAPKCPFKLLTGWDCPACGNQRALHALLHGDWAGAWRYNPYVWFALPYFALVVYTTYEHSPRAARWRRIVQHPMTVMVFFMLTMLWWLLRNIL